jgi:GMP synthase-like glutamine amidotransferase
MNLHVFQHVDFEGPGRIATWALDRGHSIITTRFYRGDPLPKVEAVDGLIIMGGPMNIYESEQYPWLISEKQFIAQFVQTGRPVFGVCLGAQLLSDVLGGKVFPHRLREIGWADVDFTAEALAHFPFLPQSIPVLHWHGDTYTLPPGARRIAQNEWCKEQAFLWKEQVLALQFHLEAASDECGQFLRFSGSDLAKAGPRVQTAGAIVEGARTYSGATGALLYQMLDHLFRPTGLPAHENSRNQPPTSARASAASVVLK